VQIILAMWRESDRAHLEPMAQVMFSNALGRWSTQATMPVRAPRFCLTNPWPSIRARLPKPSSSTDGFDLGSTPKQARCLPCNELRPLAAVAIEASRTPARDISATLRNLGDAGLIRRLRRLHSHGTQIVC
jgi:hypothetical protein